MRIKQLRKRTERLSGVVLALIFVVIITAGEMIHTPQGLVFEALCLGTCVVLIKFIDAIDAEIAREKKMVKRIKSEQALQQKRSA